MDSELILEIKPKFTIRTYQEIYKTTYKHANNIFFRLLTIMVLIIFVLTILGESFSNLAYSFAKINDVFEGFSGIAMIILMMMGCMLGLMIASLGVLALIYFLKEKYKKTTYKIFKNKIEFTENHYIKKQGTLDFSNIDDIILSQTNYQKRHDFGTIFFKLKEDPKVQIQSENVYAIKNFLFANIENPQFVYAKLKELMTNNQ